MTETEHDLDAWNAQWQEENRAILERAKAMPCTTQAEYLMAMAMFGRFAECEQVRLKCRHAVLLRREAQERR